MENHETIEKLLTDFALGQLPQDQNEQIQRHLEQCHSCRQQLKKLRDLLQLTDQLRSSSAPDELCESAKDNLFEAVKSHQPAPARIVNLPTVWSKIMNSKITKLAAAAVILIAVVIVVATFTNSGDQTVAIESDDEATLTQTVDKESQDNVEVAAQSDDVLDLQLQQVEQLFAAGDTAGLIDMLSTGKYEAKVAAANYLAQLGDVDAVAPLEVLAAQYSGTENPFAAAAEQIKAAAESEPTTGPNDTEQIVPAAIVPASSEIFELLPAETLFCVRINYFDYALGQMDQYLSGVVPIPMPATMGVRSLVAKILADASLVNVDTSAALAIAGLTASKDPNNQSMDDLLVVLLVPMKDYDKFIAENQNASAPDANGISVIKTGQKNTLIARLGVFGLTTLIGDYKKLNYAVNLLADNNAKLASSLAPADLTQAKQRLFWAYTNVQKASGIFGPVAKQKLEELKKILEQQKSGPPEAINIYYVMLDILTQEVESLSLSIEPTDNLLSINFNTVATPNTPMARMFTADTEAKKQNELLGYLPEGSIFNVALKLNTPLWEELSLTDYDLITLMSDKEVPDETFDKIQALLADMTASSDGDSVMSLTAQLDSNSMPFAATWVAKIKDEQKWRNANQELMKLWGQSSLREIYADSFDIQVEYKMTQAAESYRGVSIDAITCSMDSTDPNSEYAQLIQNVYGQGINYRWAFTDGLYLCSIGSNCQHQIRDLIDKAKDSIDNQPNPEITAAMQMLTEPQECDFFGTLNYVRILNIATVYMPSEISAPLTDLQFSSKSNLAFGGKVGAGRESLEIAIPKEHLIEITTAVEAMNKVMMQQYQQQAEEAAAEAATEPNTTDTNNLE
jgi:hypothetical protein